MHLLWLIKINHSNSHKTYKKCKLVTFPNGVFFLIVNTKNRNLCITVDKHHSCILKLPNLPKSVEYQVYWAGKKKAEMNTTKSKNIYIENERSLSLNDSSWIFLAAPTENLYSRVKVTTMYFLCRWVARQFQYSLIVFLKTLMISLYSMLTISFISRALLVEERCL